MAEKNIYQRVNEVRKKVHYIKKDKTVQSYKAVTHDHVTAICRNHMIEQGIIVVPNLSRSCVDNVGTTKTGATIIRYSGVYDIEFVNADDPSDKIVITSEGHANDSGDKAPGKATSYATKYAMLKIFSIETGENEESRFDAYGMDEPIGATEAAKIKALIAEKSADTDKFLEFFGVCDVKDMPKAKYKEAVQLLEAKK